ncbi:MAG: TetR/AcrR family transcriptional regulator [Saprospiraceae bacterium]|nr:TetR/AcrR family transcriptional regulator [Saprospiraceae bacterium]
MTTTSQDINWLERVEKLFLRFGIKSITMDDVAADLGISKKTLYQMVESKDDLVIKVLERHISREKEQCINLSAVAPNALEEIFIIMDSNSQEMAQMKTNIINDLQKYHRPAWELLQKFHYDFVYQVIRQNLHRGRKEGLYRDNFVIDILAKLHLATAFNMFDPTLFPDGNTERVVLFNEYMMHYLHGIVSPKGLTYLQQKLS